MLILKVIFSILLMTAGLVGRKVNRVIRRSLVNVEMNYLKERWNIGKIIESYRDAKPLEDDFNIDLLPFFPECPNARYCG